MCSAGVALAAAILGTFAATHYHRLGLTLTHYDARGHLIVARRIFDSITPGWQQIGAVWLPLPHLLNAIPIQNDFLYRTGASGVAISIASFAIATGAIAWITVAITGSILAATAGALVFALNPNVLYLQSTPMTEPLLMALTCLSIALLIARDTGLRHRGDLWRVASGEWRAIAMAFACGSGAVGVVFALACLTRYEAWAVTVSALGLIWMIGYWPDRLGRTDRDDLRDIGRIALYPLVAIVAFTLFSRVVVGQWFVAGDFFVPENKSLGDWWMSIKEIAWGTQVLSSGPLVWIAGIGLIATICDRGDRLAPAHRPRHAGTWRDGGGAICCILQGPSLSHPIHGPPHRSRSGRMRSGSGNRPSRAAPVAMALIVVAATTLRPLDARHRWCSKRNGTRPTCRCARRLLRV